VDVDQTDPAPHEAMRFDERHLLVLGDCYLRQRRESGQDLTPSPERSARKLPSRTVDPHFAPLQVRGERRMAKAEMMNPD
jgi:hypothetical protein